MLAVFIAACTVLIPRVLIVSAVLNPCVALALLPMLLPVLATGVALVFVGWRANEHQDRNAPPADTNPLRLVPAMQMAVVFQLSIVAIAFVQRTLGTPGLYATATALGLTDMDALTFSMSRRETALTAGIAARHRDRRPVKYLSQAGARCHAWPSELSTPRRFWTHRVGGRQCARTSAHVTNCATFRRRPAGHTFPLAKIAPLPLGAVRPYAPECL